MTKARSLIAVVDDEESIRRALKRLMESAGFKVELFANGGEFLNSLGSHSPDCVVLDLHMPEVSGFEVQSRLAQGGHTLAVITLTGHDTPESQKRVMDAGALAYLRKPVDDVELLDAVTAAVSSGQAPNDESSSSE